MRNYLGISALFVSTLCFGQVDVGGLPTEWASPALERHGLPEVQFPAPDEDDGPVTANGLFRYGSQRFLSVNVLEQGRWDALDDGTQLCRMVLRSPGALMLSIQFDRWELPEGALVYIYDTDRNRFMGGFDRNNRAEDGTMATAVLSGEAVVIEYRVPANARSTGSLRVSSITHGFVDLYRMRDADAARDYDPGYQSAPCHINTICPEAAAWQLHKRSVAMFLRPDGNGCTGNLVNNTQTPGRPYFHMANHCYTATNNSQWVFYFNYESPACVGSTGPTTQTLTGATLRASYYYNDMCLMELTNTPPASYGVYYAGWDRSGAVPQNSTVIQHPLYDVKKIAFNNDASTTFTDAIGVPAWRGTWENGLVQAVSSGSPLFDQNQRQVGHMYAGAQVCSTATSIPTDCAKFSAGWDGAVASQRMRDWLDPANTVMQLNGYNPNAAPPLLVRIKAFLEGPYNTTTAQMNSTLRTNGLVPLTEPYTAANYTHVGGGGESTTASVLNVTGANAVVDWVVVELRNRLNSTQVLATRSGLLQADGDVVAADGTSALSFSLPTDQYFIAVRHRNHLGVMTATATSLTTTSITLDLSNGSVALFGGTLATKVVGTRNCLLSGDTDRNGTIIYTGPNNDRDPLLARIGGTVPTATVAGYYPEDLNMDGVVRYTGGGNDRDIILVNIGGSVPTATRAAQLP